MTMAEPDRDTVTGLDTSIFSLSSTSSFYSGFDARALLDPVLNLEEYPPHIDDFPFSPDSPDLWHELGMVQLEDTVVTSGFDLHPNERPWEAMMALIEDSSGYQLQDTYSQFDYVWPSSLSLTQPVALEVKNTIVDSLGETLELSFAATLPSLGISIYEPITPCATLCSQASPSDSPFLSPPSRRSRINSVSTTPSSPSTCSIFCSWEHCGKTFPTNAALNHHLRYHTKPLHCPHCPLQHGTKRLLDRHINERHFNTEKYYCTVVGCSRSMVGELEKGGRHFTREENCRRHLKKMHGISWTRKRSGARMDMQGKEGKKNPLVDMDEMTKQIRRERKTTRRISKTR